MKEDLSLTTGGKLIVNDPDPGQAAVVPIAQSVANHGTFTVQPDGTWTYHLDNAQPAVQALGPGQSLTDQIEVTSVDGARHQITVTIQGHIDAPTVGAAVGTALSTPGHASAEVGIVGTGHQTIQSTGFVLHSFTFGEAYETPSGTLVDVTAKPGEIGVGRLLTGMGFGVGRTSAQAGSIDQTRATEIETAAGATPGAPQKGETLVVELQGLSRSAMVTLGGFGGKGDALKWTAYGADGHPVATGSMVGTDATNPTGVALLSIESKAPFAYVAIEATTPPAYTEVLSTHGAPVTHQFTTGFSVTEVQAELEQFSTPLNLRGALGDPADPDQSLSWRIDGLRQGSLSAGTHNPDGSWTVTAADLPGLSVLHAGAQQITVTAVATDAGTGITAQSAPQSLTLDPHGAHYTVITGAPVMVTDENATTALKGDFDVSTDKAVAPDFVADTQTGVYGTFHINTDGTWTYQLDTAHAQQLTAAGFRETFQIQTVDGASRSVTVLITGEDDRPVVVDKDAPATHTAAPVVGGHLGATDVDSAGVFVFTAQGTGHPLAGQYGSATIDLHSGAWSYAVDPARAATIPAGTTMTGAFTFNAVGVSSHQRGQITGLVDVDASGKAVVRAEAGIADRGAVTEDTDVDHGSPMAAGALGGVATGEHVAGSHPGAYGTFTLTDDGHWTYAADNAQPAIQSLDTGEHLTDAISVVGASGQTYALAVTIHGTDETPHLSTMTSAPCGVAPPPPAPEPSTATGLDHHTGAADHSGIDTAGLVDGTVPSDHQADAGPAAAVPGADHSGAAQPHLDLAVSTHEPAHAPGEAHTPEAAAASHDGDGVLAGDGGHGHDGAATDGADGDAMSHHGHADADVDHGAAPPYLALADSDENHGSAAHAAGADDGTGTDPYAGLAGEPPGGDHVEAPPPDQVFADDHSQCIHPVTTALAV